MQYPTPPSYLLYEEAKVVGAEIIKMARESMIQARSEMQPGTVISVDGSWEHRRHAQRCVTTIFCLDSRKVVDYAVISSRLEDGVQNYCPVSQNMEVEGMKRMIPHLKDDPRIVAYVHDKDARTANAIKRAEWHIHEYIDPGHAMKSFDRKLQKKDYKGVIEDWVAEKLRSWMRTILKSSAEEEEKVKDWHNAVNHLMGDHSKCPFQHGPTRVWEKLNDATIRQKVEKFMHDVEWIVRSSMNQYATQINESFNRGKLKYCSKEVKWRSSFEPRICCAILDRNVPFWKLELYYQLGLGAMNAECYYFLTAKEEERLKYKDMVTSPEYLEERRLERKAKKQELKARTASVAGKTGYKPNPYQ
jgi:hypothetical protein